LQDEGKGSIETCYKEEPLLKRNGLEVSLTGEIWYR
jgi:hypothetical protein